MHPQPSPPLLHSSHWIYGLLLCLDRLFSGHCSDPRASQATIWRLTRMEQAWMWVDFICHAENAPTHIHQHVVSKNNKKKKKRIQQQSCPSMHMHYANCVIRATCLEVKQRGEQTRLVGVKSEFGCEALEGKTTEIQFNALQAWYWLMEWSYRKNELNSSVYRLAEFIKADLYFFFSPATDVILSRAIISYVLFFMLSIRH